MKNLAISGTVANSGYTRVIFDNCKNVVLDNVVVQKNDINVGVGIANNGSNIFMMNGAGVDSTSFAVGAIKVAYGGTVTIEPLDTDPTNPGWFVGAKYYIKTPVSAGPVGKVWVSAAVGWKAFGTIA